MSPIRPNDRVRAALAVAAALALVLVSAPRASAIELGQVDDFQDGTTEDWVKGALSMIPIENVADGGPEGDGDRYMRNVSDGEVADGKQVVMNGAQWTGDYAAAGVGAITLQANNLSAPTLYVRIGLEGPGGVRFVSTEPLVLTSNSGWSFHAFELSETTMTLVEGVGSFGEVFSNVLQARIISSENPDWRGDFIVATLGIDNIRARPSVIPTNETTWGRIKAETEARTR